MSPIKKLLSFAFLLLGFSGKPLYGQFLTSGQYGLQASLLMPTGYYSYVLKPAPAVELFVKMGDIDQLYSFGLSLGYCSFKATQDTFPTYAVGGQYGNLYPGYEVLHSYDELLIGLTNDFRILPSKKLCPFVGIDIHFDAITIAEDDYAETISQSSSSGDNYWQLAILPRIGLQYKLSDKFYLAGSFGRNIGITGTIIAQDYWKPCLTVTYTSD